MIKEGLWESKKRKKLKLHQRRNRRDQEGELVQVDGSPHAWFEERGPKCCLLGFIDDATSRVKYLKFVPSESCESYFLAFREYMYKHGKPMAFYTDRLSVFRVNTDKAGYKKSGLTQVGRALKELGVKLICANSPQAKGRVERLFNTLQDRLVNELTLRGIRTMEEGNAYLPEYIEEHNARFAIPAAQEEDVHRPVSKEEADAALCWKEERTLSKQLELSYAGRIFQIEPEEVKYRLIGAKVIVVEDVKGEITIQYEGKGLKFRELMVRDHQGRILGRKEVLFSEAS